MSIFNAGAGKVVLYSNKTCPFAHRAWIVLVEKGIPHEFVTVPLSGELTKMKAGGVASAPAWADSGLALEEIQKIKDDYKAAINSTGEVPTIVVRGAGFAGGAFDDASGDVVVREADVCAEFLDDAFPDSGTRLLPADAYLRSKTRHYLKILGGQHGVSAHYGLLKNQDPANDVGKRDSLYKGLATFAEMADTTGPFFLGAEISFADLMLAPFYHRWSALLPHWRGVPYIPVGDDEHPWAPRMAAWAAALEAHPAYVHTKLDAQRAIDAYKGYAGDRGQSTVGA